MKKIISFTIFTFIFLNTLFINSGLLAKDQISVSAPMTTDLAGKSGSIAIQSIFRILVPSKNRSGSAFLHKSGNVITAAHIVEDCNPNDIFLLNNHGQKYTIKKVITDYNLDLALLIPSTKLTYSALPISTNKSFSIGMQVTTWGFPNGYKGLTPLLSVGYLSGIDTIKANSGKRIKRWVVNAAFNSGNSGGPLINVEDGTVIGVVTSKLAPTPLIIEKEIEALKNQNIGVKFSATKQDGTKIKISQGKVIADVLEHLRNQTQLVIGHTAMIEDLKNFLNNNSIETTQDKKPITKQSTGPDSAPNSAPSGQ